MVVYESANVLPVDMMARATNEVSMTGFSTKRGAGIVTGASMKAASADISALGASGNSLAAETPVMIAAASKTRRKDFMVAPCVTGFALDFVVADAVRSVMKTDYVRTCT